MIERSDLWESGPGMAAIQNVILKGQEYWITNVYNHYNRGTGQLGGACLIQFQDGKFVVSMKPLIDMDSGTEYGRSIRRGIPPGVGRYDPKLRIRKHTGYYPGVSRSKFWEPWMAEFQPMFKSIVREETMHAVRAYIHESIRRRS